MSVKGRLKYIISFITRAGKSSETGNLRDIWKRQIQRQNADCDFQEFFLSRKKRCCGLIDLKSPLSDENVIKIETVAVTVLSTN